MQLYFEKIQINPLRFRSDRNKNCGKKNQGDIDNEKTTL